MCCYFPPWWHKHSQLHRLLGEGRWYLPRTARRAAGSAVATDAGSSKGGGFSASANKYWLWALDPAQFPLVAYVDLDVLILSNLDALLHIELDEKTPIAAVTAAPICQSRSFNGGLLVFRPSLRTATTLLLAGRLLQWPHKGDLPDFDHVRLTPGGEPLMVVNNSRKGAGRYGRYHDGELSLAAVELCEPLNCQSSRCLRAQQLYPNVSVRAARALCRQQYYKRGLARSNSFQRTAQPGTGAPLTKSMMKSCEPGLHDQSVLNWVFQGAWRRLPRAYNIQPPLWDALDCSGTLANGSMQVGALHYAGVAKPWWRTPHRTHIRVAPLSQRSVRLWRDMCPDVKLVTGFPGSRPTSKCKHGLLV